MHGLGNDYVYINGLDQDLSAYSLPDTARLLSDRNFGVGGDGIILVLPSEVGDFRMRVFNSDGSEAEMCGNGIRAFAKYVFEHGLTNKTDLAIETGAGIIRPRLRVENGRVVEVCVDMGEPRLARRDIPMKGDPPDQPAVNEVLYLGGEPLIVTCVSMGNPHCVVFVDDVDNYPVHEVGRQLEYHAAFPNRTNVEFAAIIDPQHIEMRVWERGAGETLACGTGACATLVAAAITNRTARKATVELAGGNLQIEWADDNHVYMTGPAAEVFSGELSAEFEEMLR